MSSMRILKFYNENTIRVQLDTIEDLWTIQRIIFSDDVVKSKSERRFKPNEGDESERKDVVVTIRVEKTEFDRSASRLRIFGIILDGSPLKYVQLKTHHTLNIPPHHDITITKEEWPEYLINVIKDAVSDTKKPRLGIILIDEEKTLSASLLGYGIKFRNEIYSHCSKRLTQKDFKLQQDEYYRSIAKEISEIGASVIIIGGPGFTKDSVKEYMEKNSSILIDKEIIFENVSNTERSGVYELIRGAKVEHLLKRERIRKEFILMEEFLQGLSIESSGHGISAVKEAVDNQEASIILVNDDRIGDKNIQHILNNAEKMKIRIEVFNSLDEVGQQLHSFNDIVYISR